MIILNYFTLILEHIMGLSVIVVLSGALHNERNLSLFTMRNILVFDIFTHLCKFLNHITDVG